MRASTSSGLSIARKRPRTDAASNTFVPSPICCMAGHTTDVAKYLSPEWIDELDRAAQASDLVRAAAPDLVFVVEHEVTGLPEGTVRYHIAFDRGSARLRPGAAGGPRCVLHRGPRDRRRREQRCDQRAERVHERPTSDSWRHGQADRGTAGHRGARRRAPRAESEDHVCLSFPSCRRTPNVSRRDGAATCCASSRRSRSRR